MCAWNTCGVSDMNIHVMVIDFEKITNVITVILLCSLQVLS